ncbi:hypothetical protein RNJ44_01374 [Nakaseomyces bracarensis]|uniref:Uncharacterized protein n=1 Tax=Nakaseomyces bracarensis TaxID=273131 RepID=A0ABR4NPM4_9SACH
MDCCDCNCHSSNSHRRGNKPRLIILIRHGESESNLDKAVNEKIPNHLIPLTDLGWKEARNAAVALLKVLNLDKHSEEVIKKLEEKYVVENDCRTMLKTSPCTRVSTSRDTSIVFYTSPYRRTKETLKGILDVVDEFNELNVGIKVHPEQKYEPCCKRKHSFWPRDVNTPTGIYENNITMPQVPVSENIDGCYLQYKVKNDPRIREQDFGNYQNVDSMNDVMKERKNYGHFFYRFPQGESAADVYDRVASFQESLFRKFERRTSNNPKDIVVLVTHGIYARIFLMKWFRWTYEEYESFTNVPNGSMMVMELNEATDRYILRTELPKWCQ